MSRFLKQEVALELSTLSLLSATELPSLVKTSLFLVGSFNSLTVKVPHQLMFLLLTTMSLSSVNHLQSL